MMRRFWPVLLVLVVVVLSFGQAQAHSGHAARADQRVATQSAGALATPQARASFLTGILATRAGVTHGLPCCPADNAAGKCCTSVGCTITTAMLPASGLPATLPARRGGTLGPPPPDFVTGISGTPPLPPPRSFAVALIG
jgi:hypothetical protein